MAQEESILNLFVFESWRPCLAVAVREWHAVLYLQGSVILASVILARQCYTCKYNTAEGKYNKQGKYNTADAVNGSVGLQDPSLSI